MIGGQDHVEPVGIGLKKITDASHGDKTQDHCDDAPDDECRSLNQVGPDHGPQSAVRGVKGRDDADNPHSQREVDTKYGLKCQASAVEHGRDGDGDVDNHGVESHDGSRDRAESVFEELRDGEDSAFKELGQKEYGDNNKSNGGDPFVAGDRHSHMARALPGHAYELFGGYIGGDKRETDQIPHEVSGRQEIILTGFLFLTAFVEADPDDTADKCQEYPDVNPA